MADQHGNQSLDTVADLALKHFGRRSQLIAAAEELCELSVVLLKMANGKAPKDKTIEEALVDELADVSVVLCQVGKLIDEKVALAVPVHVQYKVNKLYERIMKEKAEREKANE